MMDLLKEILSEVALSINVSNTSLKISECFSCDCARKFKKTMGITTDDDLLQLLTDRSKYTIAFHGTTEAIFATNIMCTGWNVNMRKEQMHGPGEYFTDSFKEASCFAAPNGAVIIALIIPSCNTSVLNVSGKNKWYVVRNTQENVYCLPLAFIKQGEVTNKCPNQTRDLMKRLVTSDTIVQYLEVGVWRDYSKKNNQKIVSETLSGNLVFNISENRKSILSLFDMSEIEIRTGYTRKIRFNS